MLYGEALYNPENSLEIKSNYVYALTLQAKICFNLEKYRDTIQILSKALEIKPKSDNDIALFYRNEAKFKQGLHEENRLIQETY
ncbi:13645_t:CDS:2 [Gigaspora margarita]|uniref:13645_t:CDS:1 n=1 Tax=Gigaspora margarita TaxID=4874 RepID=A0ABN7V304_GIGMA|nr:13645_t:CDS:2 [Gigaspora margarita]